MPLIKASHTVSMGHRLPSYEGICSSPHGHNVTFNVLVRNHDAFIDFKKLSDHLKNVINDFDHAMVLWEHDPIREQFEAWKFRTVILSVEPTTEAIATYVFSQIRDLSYDVAQVEVEETAKYSAIATHGDIQVKRVV